MAVKYILVNFNFLLIVCKSFPLTEGPSVTINIEDGTIAGRVIESYDNIFYAFQELPYAAPPIGPLRFKEPQPPLKWDGVRNATENTKICVIFGNSTDSRQNEDCLYLNVYTPVDPRNEIRQFLPVIVWIHGGSFLAGSGAYSYFGPDFFMSYGVILVTVNYRVGPLGFLTTGDGVIPGNNGLRDQNFALQWVQRNIKYFGGDPDQVTLMGQSAGAASVGYHVISEKSKGLFRSAIMQSGSPLNCWTLQKYPKEAAYIFGQQLNSDFTNSSEELLRLLQDTPLSDLINASNTVGMPEGLKNCYEYFYLTWTPVVEDESLENAFITGYSHENIKSGKVNKVPLLMGFNSQEVLLFNLDLIQAESVLFDYSDANIINENLNMAQGKKVSAGSEMRKMYTNKSFVDDFAGSCRFASDCLFTTPVARHAYLHSQYSGVYFYQFSYDGKIGELVVNQTVDGAEGVGHEEEVEYLFLREGNQDLNQFPESDLVTQERLLTMWTGFAKTINPTSEKLDILQNIIWPRATPDQFSYLDINRDLTVHVGPKYYQKWEQIINKYADSILSTY